MKNITRRRALITKNYILTNQKINFADQNFSSENGVKKYFYKIGKYN